MTQLHSDLVPHYQQIIASIMLAEIAGYDDRPVFEQIDLISRARQLFERAVAESGSESVQVVDRENSIVLIFPGDPRDCLGLATRLAATLETDQRYSSLPLRVGVNLGPVTLTRNKMSEIWVSGSGIDDAERVARAGSLREILMSRSYYTVLSRASMDDRLLRHKAFVTDERDLSFAVYQIARPETTLTRAELPAANLPAALDYTARRGRARWSAIAASALVVTGAIAIFYAQAPNNTPFVQAPQNPAKTAAANTTQPLPAAPKAAIEFKAPERESAAITEKLIAATTVSGATQATTAPRANNTLESSPKSQAMRPVTVQLAIKPWGEIYVDGKKVGVTPPLRKIDLPPGKRLIVVRNADFLPFETTLDIQPESLLQISHRFDK